jgi:putative addiction module component (TIGR02574 family)
VSKAEILAALPTLTPAERQEILLKLAELEGTVWLDRDDPLTEEDKALIEARIDAHEKDPDSAIPWDEFKARLKRKS